MESNRRLERLIRYFSKSRRSTLLAALMIALALLVFMFSSGIWDGGQKMPKEHSLGQPAASDPAEQLETKLERMLCSMQGVGRARVMLTFEKSAESIVAVDQKLVAGDKSSTNESHPATVQSGGKEEPIVLTEVLPTIRGVLVLAEGAANITVKCSIAAAVSTVLGIDETLVEVFVMESG